MFDKIQEQKREEYAKNHDCTWVIYGSHDICK